MAAGMAETTAVELGIEMVEQTAAVKDILTVDLKAALKVELKVCMMGRSMAVQLVELMVEKTVA
jgi:hypothetical protein